MDKLLTIQIPTFNNLKQLRDTLCTLISYTEYPYKIVVINNDPHPNGKKAVEEVVSDRRLDIELIHAGSNLGWTGAHNLALKKCDTPYVCLMNDDVMFMNGDGGFWRRMMGWFRDPSVGAVGPSSNFVTGSQNIWNYEMHLISETSLLIGFCVVMRTDLIKKLGGLDETLPGGDDFDWSIRIREAGHKLVIDKSCFLFHIGQQTGRRVKPGYWDSHQHQEATQHALIRKHGMKKWYDCMRSMTQRYGPPVEEIFNEGEWYQNIADAQNGHSGLNLGSGHMKVNGVPGLDIARPGDYGAGGRKFSGATNDLVGDACRLPVETKSLDYLFAAHIFEHLLDPVASLEEWSRVLKDGGMLYASLPNHDCLQTMLIDSTHVHAYTPESFARLISKLGWDVLQCEAFKNSGSFGVIAQNRE